MIKINEIGKKIKTPLFFFFFEYHWMVIAAITLTENQFVTRGNGVGVPRNSEG